jgi:hypothetical protein
MSLYAMPVRENAFSGIAELKKYQLTIERQYLLLQAILDNQKAAIRDALDRDPELLLVIGLDGIDEGVGNERLQNRYTWQTLAMNKPLVNVLVSDQVEIVKVLLPYFDKLEDGRSIALEQWEEAISIKKRRQSNSTAFLHQIIDSIINNDVENLENHLKTLRNKLLLCSSTTQTDEYDVYQLLLFAYQACINRYSEFQDWQQRDFFAVNIIGFCQSLLPPEYAHVLCRGLFSVVEHSLDMNKYDSRLRLSYGELYYRDSPFATSGLGYNYFVGGEGEVAHLLKRGSLSTLRHSKYCLEQYHKLKMAELAQLKEQLIQSVSPRIEQPARCCIIS